MTRSLSVLSALAFAAGASAADWRPAEGASLGFTGSYQGQPFQGQFQRFTPDIRFDADDLDGSRFEVEIEVAGARTGTAEYDEYMHGEDFLASVAYPTARFVAGDFRAEADDRFEADAELTIRGKTVPIVFPFRFVDNGDTAQLSAEVTIRRLDFDVGTGEWGDPSLIANEVKVTVDLPLIRQ